MLSGDLADLAEIVEDFEDHDDVDGVDLEEFQESDVGQAATAHLTIEFNGPNLSSAQEAIGVSTGGLADRSLDETYETRMSESEDDDGDGDEEKWCGRCGHGPANVTGISIHHGHKHDGEKVLLDHDPSEEELVGDVDDTADEGDGEDSDDEYEPGDPVPDEAVADEDDQEAASDGGEVELPAGIDEDDVYDLANDSRKLYEVTDALDEQTDADLTDEKVRSFLVALNCYDEVRDIRSRPGGASA